jgi:predicted Zn-dependent protease
MLGCANVQLPAPMTGGISERRREREAELVREYEQKRNEAHYQAALSRWQQGDGEFSRTALEQLLARCPEHLEARLLLAEVYLGRNDPVAAKRQLEIVLADHPGDARAVDALALVDELLGGEKRADAEDWDQFDDLAACAHTPPGREALRRAAAATRARQPAAARDELRRAMAVEPQNPQIPIRAALYALELNQPETAGMVLDEAVVRFPGSPGVHRLCGLTLYRQGDYEASQVAFQQALSLDNTDALSYFLLGHSLERVGQSEAAAQQFQQARRLDPTLPLER